MKKPEMLVSGLILWFDGIYELFVCKIGDYVMVMPEIPNNEPDEVPIKEEPDETPPIDEPRGIPNDEPDEVPVRK